MLFFRCSECDEVREVNTNGFTIYHGGLVCKHQTKNGHQYTVMAQPIEHEKAIELGYTPINQSPDHPNEQPGGLIGQAFERSPS